MNVTRPLHALAVGLAALGLTAATHATESGSPTTAFGVYDFGAGFTPPPTPHGTLGLRSNFYRATAIRDSHGRDNGNDLSIDVLSLGLAYLKMTDTRVLGARYGFGGVQPFFRMDADLTVKANGVPVFADSATLFRQADIQVIPLILQWEPSRNLGVNFWFQVQAPTGDYDKNRLVNPGTHHWTVSPMLNLSYISDSGFGIRDSRCRPASRPTSTAVTPPPTTAAARNTVTNSPWVSTSAPGPRAWAATTTASSPTTTPPASPAAIAPGYWRWDRR